jgi:hypothetical protein
VRAFIHFEKRLRNVSIKIFRNLQAFKHLLEIRYSFFLISTAEINTLTFIFADEPVLPQEDTESEVSSSEEEDEEYEEDTDDEDSEGEASSEEDEEDGEEEEEQEVEVEKPAKRRVLKAKKVTTPRAKKAAAEPPKTSPPAAARKRKTTSAAAATIAAPPTKKKKEEKKKGEKKKKKSGPQHEVIQDASSKHVDFSRPAVTFNHDVVILGDRYTMQVKRMNVTNAKQPYTYDSLCIERAPLYVEGEDEKKKPFVFNMPARLLPAIQKGVELMLSPLSEAQKKQLDA